MSPIQVDLNSWYEVASSAVPTNYLKHFNWLLEVAHLDLGGGGGGGGGGLHCWVFPCEHVVATKSYQP